jgi:glycosyltransferase involved in cell wall biosynthesis
MPNVILEGMSRGLAVIATDVGAVPAMVDSRNGWLIKPMNKAELINALREAMHLPAELLQQKQLASIQRVQSEFTWEEISARTEAAISHLVAKQSTITAG